jgi:hypothetical protein
MTSEENSTRFRSLSNSFQQFYAGMSLPIYLALWVNKLIHPEQNYVADTSTYLCICNSNIEVPYLLWLFAYLWLMYVRISFFQYFLGFLLLLFAHTHPPFRVVYRGASPNYSYLYAFLTDRPRVTCFVLLTLTLLGRYLYGELKFERRFSIPQLIVFMSVFAVAIYYLTGFGSAVPA